NPTQLHLPARWCHCRSCRRNWLISQGRSDTGRQVDTRLPRLLVHDGPCQLVTLPATTDVRILFTGMKDAAQFQLLCLVIHERGESLPQGFASHCSTSTV